MSSVITGSPLRPLWALLAATLVGCGVGGGGSPTSEFVCRGAGVVVGGTATFVKREYDENGLTGARRIKPIRYAKVEIVLSVDGRVVATTYTDASGNYCMEVRGVPTGFSAVYPRVVSQTDKRRFNIAVVNDILAANLAYYSRAGAEFDGTQAGNHVRDIAVPVVTPLNAFADFPLAGAFNILDVASRGAETATAVEGWFPTNTVLLIGWTPGTVYGDGTVGTYFVGDDPTKSVAGIELSGGSNGGPDEGDHDEYDDDVILHEFGHFMSYLFSAPAEVGGAHYLNDNTQDIRLAWSEGWATFFSAAVRKNPVMVNTRGGDPGHPEHSDSYAFDIENPHSALLSMIGTPLEEHGVYTTSEVAVASVLWDLYDARNEDGDRKALGLDGVWDVYTRMAAAPSNVSLETFAQYFGAQFGWGDLSRGAALRRVQFAPDQYENQLDGAYHLNPPTVLSGQPTCHTLFPLGDVDVVKFTVAVPSTVTVETLNLSNGADTVVRLLGAGGIEIAQNDNSPSPRTHQQFQPTGCGNRGFDPIPAVYFNNGINNGANFASKIQIAVDAGVYYAEVSSRSAGGFGAGQMGSYDLIITIQ